MSPKQCGNLNCPKRAFQGEAAAVQLCSRCRTTAYCFRECQAASWFTYKAGCKRQHYIIKFPLSPNDIVDPPAVRTISCPADAEFYMLHLALKLAFGWATTHTFDFAVANPEYQQPEDMESLFQKLTRRSSSASFPRMYEFRVTDPVERIMFNGIDRLH